jgi:hypothetical protein
MEEMTVTWAGRCAISIGTEIERFLAAYPEDVQAVALSAHDFLQEMLPAIEHRLDRPAKLIGYAYGPGYKGLICTLIFSQKGIKLGIVRGSELPDPKHLMTGQGKVHRHVPLRRVGDLKTPGLRALLKVALAAWKERYGMPPELQETDEEQ